MAEPTDPVRRYEARVRTRDPFPVRPGIEVRIHTRIREGEKERTQVFEGLVVALHGAGYGKTFTVRRVVSGIGVERIFPMFSPRVTAVDIIGAQKVRRAKLTYLRMSNVKRRTKEDQKVLQRALAEQGAQRRAAEKAKREAEERERAKAEVERKKQEAENAEGEKETATDQKEKETPQD